MLLPPDRHRSLLDYKILAAYMAGTSSGALLTALVAWVLSGFTEPLGDGVRLALLGIGALLVWLIKQGFLSKVITLPEARRQIPAEVFGGSLARGAYQFGFELGTGVRTYVTSPAPYILLLVMMLARLTLMDAIFVGLGYGLGRAVPLMVFLRAAEQFRTTNPFLRGSDYAASTAATLFILAGALSLV